MVQAAGEGGGGQEGEGGGQSGLLWHGDCVEAWPDRQMWMDKEEGSLVGLTEAQENRLVGNMVHLAMGRQAQTEETHYSLDRPRQCPSPEQSLVYRPRVRQASVHNLKGGSSLEKFYQLKWVWAVSLKRFRTFEGVE